MILTLPTAKNSSKLFAAHASFSIQTAIQFCRLTLTLVITGSADYRRSNDDKNVTLKQLVFFIRRHSHRHRLAFYLHRVELSEYACSLT